MPFLIFFNFFKPTKLHSMRKLATRVIAFLFFLIPLVSQAQTTITGRVIKDDGGPAEGASVTVKGKANGTKTDAQGNFKISANKGDVLIVSSVNFVTQQVTVKDATITVRLKLVDKTLDEVVVTAMDIKRNPRELGYSSQQVKG